MNTTALLCFMIALYCGCSGPVTFSGNYLRNDATRTVTILTDDGRTILLRAGEYTVHQYQDSAVVSGTGTMRMRDGSIEHDFRGTIDLRDITEVEIQEPASSWFSLPVAGLALSLFVIIVYLATVHIST